jgi:hypothetical protein
MVTTVSIIQIQDDNIQNPSDASAGGELALIEVDRNHAPYRGRQSIEEPWFASTGFL